MDHTDSAQQVWIFVKENDQWHHQPLFLALLEFLRREGVAGATVVRGIAGYGSHRQVHTASLVELSSDLPLVIIFVDRADPTARGVWDGAHPHRPRSDPERIVSRALVVRHRPIDRSRRSP